MDNEESDLQTLGTLVRDLVARVERLERSAEIRATAASDPSHSLGTREAGYKEAGHKNALTSLASSMHLERCGGFAEISLTGFTGGAEEVAGDD